nr:MAG TPA: hypothetical protein [Bacteriophage sp.]
MCGRLPVEAVVNFELVKVLPTFWPARRWAYSLRRVFFCGL